MLREIKYKIHYKIRDNFFRTDNLNKVNKDILFVGDSLTERFPLELFSKDIINRGISGDTTDGLINRLDNSIIELNSKVIVLLIGTNDISYNKSNDYIVKNIIYIINMINKKLPLSKLYIQSLYPVDENSSKIIIRNRSNTIISEINKLLKDKCSNLNCEFINTYDCLLDENNNLNKNYTNDGLHLNKVGYIKVVNYLKDKIDYLK